MSPADMILNFTRAIISIAHHSSLGTQFSSRWIVVSSAARSFRLIVELTKGKPWESRLIILFTISWDSRAGVERRGAARRGRTCSPNDVKRRIIVVIRMRPAVPRRSQNAHERSAIFLRLSFLSPFSFERTYLPCYRYPPRKVAARSSKVKRITHLCSCLVHGYDLVNGLQIIRFCWRWK